jgi:hypothetical protein
MATNDEHNAAHILNLLEHAPGRQLSAEALAEQTGWSPEELSAAVGLPNMATASFTSVRKEADRVAGAGVRLCAR